MYCSACGQQLFDHVRFCHVCGAPVVASRGPSPALPEAMPPAQAPRPDPRPPAAAVAKRPRRTGPAAYARLWIVALASIAAIVTYQLTGRDDASESRTLTPSVSGSHDQPVAPRPPAQGERVAELPRVAPAPDDERLARSPAAETPSPPAPTTHEPRPSRKDLQAAPRAAPPAVPAVRDLVTAAARGEAAEVDRLTLQLARTDGPRGDRAAARVLNTQGLAASQTRRYSDAAALFLKAREADPGDPEIRENLGYALMKADDTAGAEAALVSALETGPRRVTAWGSLGFVYAKQDRREEAIAMLRTAHRISPDPNRVLDTYARQAQTEDDPRVRAVLAETVRRIGGLQRN